ncbi:MAG: FtsX-like permease family protein, partial [bacterium]
FIGFLSGSYLALYLSSLNPIDALKNKIFISRKFNLSKILIVFQLFITLSLLICVMIIFAQIRYCLTKDCGIEKGNLLLVSFDPATIPVYPQLKAKLLEEKAIQSVSGAGIMPPSDASISIKFNLSSDPDQPISVENYMVDAQFFKTLGAEILSGRDFDPNLPEDLKSSIILNESAVKAMNFTNPVGKSLGQFKVIGVVKDFNTHSLYSGIKPSFYQLQPAATQKMAIRMTAGKEDEAVQALRKHWNDLVPDAPVNFSTFHNQLDLMYLREQKFGQVVASFSLLAFIITGMGLFGLALLIAERKTKEVAIRKVFGATNAHILYRMLKEFLIYIGIASLLSIPVTWFLMTRWLSVFYYRIPVSWYLFLLSIVAVAIFVSAIMMLRTWTVLRKNLINALKYE